MEKICIVKLRKSLPGRLHDGGNGGLDSTGASSEAAPRLAGRAAAETGRSPGQTAHSQLIGIATGCVADDPAEGPQAASVVSLPVTGDQVRALQANPCTAALLAAQTGPADEAGAAQSESVVIRLELPAVSPLTLLKTEEVLRMLRISKSCLNRIVRQGYLRSYRLGRRGRLRRFRLEDVLTYLEDGLDTVVTEQLFPREQRPSLQGWA